MFSCHILLGEKMFLYIHKIILYIYRMTLFRNMYLYSNNNFIMFLLCFPVLCYYVLLCFKFHKLFLIVN